MEDFPPAGARRGTVRGRARLAISLALTAAVLAGAGVSSETDPREPGVRIGEFRPSPDGRWVAMTCIPERGREVGVWLLGLEGGPPRAVDGGFPSRPSGLAWNDEGQLGIDFESRTTGRHWIDPETREVVAVEGRARARAQRTLAGGWASVQERKQRGERSQVVEWVGEGVSVELSAEPGHTARVTALPGVVFHSERVLGIERIFRHDLASGQTEEVHQIESDHPQWSVSPDGRALWVQDDRRQRIVDAEHGDDLAGPWVRGSLAWIEERGSRFARLETGGHEYLIDLLLDREVHLGEEGSAGTQLCVVPDGRFLLLDRDGRLDLRDATGEVLRNLIPGDEALSR